MPSPRPLFALPTCTLLALLLTVPGAAADLTLSVQQVGATGLDIYTTGSGTLAAPQNATIASAWNGYLIDWDAPAASAGEVVGYTVYRVPGPGAGGSVQVTDLGPRWTAFYDQPDDGTYVYLVTASFSTSGESSAQASSQTQVVESVSSAPMSNLDILSNYPHCGVVGVSSTPPYIDVHISCLFP